jgi:hypothetical protein
MAVNENDCIDYDLMQVYKNSPGFRIPDVPNNIDVTLFNYSFPRNYRLRDEEYARFNSSLTKAAAGKKNGETMAYVNSFFTTTNYSKQLETRQFNDMTSRMPSFFGTVLDNSHKHEMFDGTPFDRDFLLVGLGYKDNYNQNALDTVKNMDPYTKFDKTWGVNDFKADCGELEKDVWVMSAKNSCGVQQAAASSIYTEYIQLPSDRYLASFEIGATDLPAGEDRIAQIQVVDYDNQNAVIASRDLSRKDFANTFSRFTLSVNITSKLAGHRLDIRIMYFGLGTLRTRNIKLIASPMRTTD